MQDFYSTKRVRAEHEDRTIDGVHIEGRKIVYGDGYTSWCPESVFQRDYQPVTAMSFGHAIEAMRAGHKVARAGWNGKGMWIALTPGSMFDAAHAKPGHAAAHRAAELTEGGLRGAINLMPHIDMRAADGSIVVGWLASQTDMLALDWRIVE